MKNFNWEEKLLLLVAAALAWLVVLFFSSSTRELVVPFQVEGLGKELAIANYLEGAKVILNGSNLALSQVEEKDIAVILDLTSLGASGTYTIEPRCLIKGAKVKVASCYPISLSLEIVPAVSRSLSIKPLLTGWPADGFAVQDVFFTPDRVEVYGAPPVLDKLEAAYVKLNLEGRLTSFATSAKVIVPDANGLSLSNIRFSSSIVEVGVQLEKNLSFKTVGIVPNLEGSLPPGHYIAEIELTPSVVTVRGSAKIVKNIHTLTTTPLVLTDHREPFREKLAVRLPSLVEMQEPNLIEAHVVILPLTENRQLNLSPQTKNLPQGLSVVRISPAVVKITVAGAPAALSGINQKNVSLLVDMRGTVSGLNAIKIDKSMFNLPPGVEIVDFAPNELSIQLTREE